MPDVEVLLPDYYGTSALRAEPQDPSLIDGERVNHTPHAPYHNLCENQSHKERFQALKQLASPHVQETLKVRLRLAR